MVSNDPSDLQAHSNTTNNTSKIPPPIFIKGVLSLHNNFKNIIGLSSFSCKSIFTRLKVQTKTLL